MHTDVHHTQQCTHTRTRTHGRAHTQRCAHRDVHTERCTHGRAHTGMCTHRDVHTETCTHTDSTHRDVHTGMCTQMCTHTDAHTRDAHTQTRAHTEMCIHTGMCTGRAHTEMCTHTGMSHTERCTHRRGVHTRTCTQGCAQGCARTWKCTRRRARTQSSESSSPLSWIHCVSKDACVTSPCYPAFSTHSVLLGMGREPRQKPWARILLYPMKGRTWGPLPACSYHSWNMGVSDCSSPRGGHSLPEPQVPCLTAFQGGTLLLALGPLPLNSDRSPRLNLERTAREKSAPVLGTSGASLTASCAMHFLRLPSDSGAPSVGAGCPPQTWA